jgi:hypothetical protein
MKQSAGPLAYHFRRACSAIVKVNLFLATAFALYLATAQGIGI